MYHGKIDIETATPIEIEVGGRPAGARARAMAALIMLALPFLAVGFLVRLFWRDLKAIGRAVAICFRTYAEEFARR